VDKDGRAEWLSFFVSGWGKIPVNL